MNIMKIVATFKEEGRWKLVTESPSPGYSDSIVDTKTNVSLAYDFHRRSFLVVLKGIGLEVINPILQREADKLRNKLQEEYVAAIHKREFARNKILEEAICKEYC